MTRQTWRQRISCKVTSDDDDDDDNVDDDDLLG